MASCRPPSISTSYRRLRQRPNRALTPVFRSNKPGLPSTAALPQTLFPSPWGSASTNEKLRASTNGNTALPTSPQRARTHRPLGCFRPLGSRDVWECQRKSPSDPHHELELSGMNALRVAWSAFPWGFWVEGSGGGVFRESSEWFSGVSRTTVVRIFCGRVDDDAFVLWSRNYACHVLDPAAFLSHDAQGSLTVLLAFFTEAASNRF